MIKLQALIDDRIDGMRLRYLASAREYKRTHAKAVKEYTAKWKQKNPGNIREHNRKHYSTNREALIERVTKRAQECRDALRYMSGDTCAVCGNEMKQPDFHHPGLKNYNIGSMTSLSPKKIFAELELTEAMCRKCHNKITFDSLKEKIDE